MTKQQQAVVDRFHERVIGLILKRSQALRYNPNDQAGWEKITAEIDKIEDERRAYERDCITQRQKKSEVSRGVPEGQAGTESSTTETDV